MTDVEKIEVQRLYGVRHGGVETDNWGNRFEILVGPSRGLMKDLLTLPQGTRIGIEYSPEVDQLREVKGHPISFGEGYEFYWDRIQRVARRNSLDVQYLDNIAFYVTQVEKILEAQALFERGSRRVEGNLNKHLGYMRASHRAGVEAEYAFQVEREDAILERIAELKPTVAIVGQGHGDVFVDRLEELSRRGITIGAYLAEDSTLPTLSLEHPLYERAILNEHPIPERELVVQRELIERKHRAATMGRVLANGAPDFIGTWNLRIPAQGLFELYLDANGDGRIEDILGTATAATVIDGDKVVFDKRYVLSDSSPTVIQGILHHAAEKDEDGKYPGTLIHRGGQDAFTMVPFSEGLDIDRVLGLTF